MEGPRVKILAFSCGEVPTTLSGRKQGENCCHEVPKIDQFYPYSNTQRVQPFSATGFSNYVQY